MSIEICNLRKQKPIEPYDVRVDRQSVLGNPFYMSDEALRDNVCNKYQMYFEKQIKDSETFETIFSQKFFGELNNLIITYKLYGKLRLFCWCAPKRCHAETIKKYIENNA